MKIMRWVSAAVAGLWLAATVQAGDKHTPLEDQMSDLSKSLKRIKAICEEGAVTDEAVKLAEKAVACAEAAVKLTPKSVNNADVAVRAKMLESYQSQMKAAVEELKRFRETVAGMDVAKVLDGLKKLKVIEKAGHEAFKED
jgi:multidrug resistance efflux pump